MIEWLLLAAGAAVFWGWLGGDGGHDAPPAGGEPPDVTPPIDPHDIPEADPELLDDLPEDCASDDGFDDFG